MPDGSSPSPSPPTDTCHATFAGLRFSVSENHSGLALHELFGVAHRVNRHRQALFVSRVLGKHVPVAPATLRRMAAALAEAVAGSLGGPAMSSGAAPATVLGYAETATALGHLVRDGLGDARYLHSTRRAAGGRPVLLAFEEEHSHAPSHTVFHRDPAVLAGGAPMVLVDDELTTGRTVANTIAAIQRVHRRRRYVVAALMDWRSGEARRSLTTLAHQLGTRIDTVALVTGTVEGTVTPVLARETVAGAIISPPKTAGVGSAGVVFHDIGPLGPPSRFGWDPADQQALDAAVVPAAAGLASWRGGGPALCLGTEEFMYTPLRLADGLGAGVVYQSTTRSPIRVSRAPGYPVRTGTTFPDPLEPFRSGHLYNLIPGRYEDIFVFLDEAVPRGQLAGLIEPLAAAATGRVHVVTCIHRR
ncbi:MAG: phosphoribosyltransferase family protein [Acidimicrobiales bacterium]